MVGTHTWYDGRHSSLRVNRAHLFLLNKGAQADKIKVKYGSICTVGFKAFKRDFGPVT